MGFLAVAFALLIAVASAGLGLGMAWGDPYSMAFVFIASAFWAGWVTFLMFYVGGLRGAEQEVRRASSLEDLAAGQWGRAVAAIRAALVPPAREGGPPRRTVAAAAVLRGAGGAMSPRLTPRSWLQAGQAVLVSVGLFGTFFGLSFGLRNSIPCFDASDPGFQDCRSAAREEAVAQGRTDTGGDDMLAMERGMNLLLEGARTAFSKSLAGIGLGLSYMLLWKLAERRRAALISEVAGKIDGWIPSVTGEELSRERAAELRGAVDGLAARQPDGAALSAAAGELARGAAAMVAVAERLGAASDTLGEFKAEKIAIEVARGVRGAVEDRLAPTLDNISKELRILHDMKQAQDEAVSRQLAELVGSLKREVLLPMKQEISATNAQTRDVVTAVQSLAGTVATATEAVHASSMQMAALTVDLAAFQRDAIGQLNEFAEGLNTTLGRFTAESSVSFQGMGADIRRSVDAAQGAMEGQRIAFEQSAAEARNAFASQTGALREAGAVASTAISGAGAEAAKALLVVRTEFAEALSSQRAALEGVLSQLETAFRQDLTQRQEFERKTDDALRKLEKLMARTAATDSEMRQVYREVDKTLGRHLGETGQQISAQREALDELRGALTDHLRVSADAHRKFLTDEDKHLSDVLGRLYGLVNVLAEATRVLSQRTPTNGAHERA